jgi:hypothetical protein
MKLYAYCLAEGIEMMEEPTLGISGAPVWIWKTGNLSVLVSDIDADSVPVTRDNALAHAAVVRSILNRTTPLPFRFGTIVTDEQLRSYVSAHRPALGTKLAALQGCIEMSVKIIWESVQTGESTSNPDPAYGPGATFLAEKRSEILGDETKVGQATEISSWLHEQVKDLIREEQVTLRPTEKLVLAAAHLIERSKIPQYREKLIEARQKRPELHFLSSGPWPPYSFANIELEFKTRFGVI